MAFTSGKLKAGGMQSSKGSAWQKSSRSMLLLLLFEGVSAEKSDCIRLMKADDACDTDFPSSEDIQYIFLCALQQLWEAKAET